MKISGAKRYIDNISDDGSENRRTLFKKPGGNRIRVRLLVGTVVQDPGDFRFRDTFV